jgi:Tfp pilus assembly protein PilN
MAEQGGTRLQVEGITFSNLTIADFMANLEASDRYEDVSLKVAEEGVIEGHKVVKFSLNSKIVN